MTMQITHAHDTRSSTVKHWRRGLWLLALLLAAMATAAVAGVAVAAHLTSPTTGTQVVYREPNANTREGRVPTDCVPAPVAPDQGQATSHSGPAS
jgi:hypothetical protein